MLALDTPKRQLLDLYLAYLQQQCVYEIGLRAWQTKNSLHSVRSKQTAWKLLMHTIPSALMQVTCDSYKGHRVMSCHVISGLVWSGL